MIDLINVMHLSNKTILLLYCDLFFLYVLYDTNLVIILI